MIGQLKNTQGKYGIFLTGVKENKMNHQEGRFNTFDNLSLYEQSWRPDTAPKGVILIIHGSFEHSGRYMDAALSFVNCGYSVYAFDSRGHGKSDGERAFVSSFDILIRDIKSFFALVKDREPNTPFFLLGHSVGGAVVTLFEIKYSLSCVINGIILSAPALKFDDSLFPFARILSFTAGYLFPRLKMGKLDSRFLSRDPGVIKAYNNDPFVCNEGLFAGTILGFLRAIDIIQGQMEKVKSPLLILHGTDDRLADLEGSRELYSRASSTDKTLDLYQDFYHELFNEPGKEKVFADVVSWLDAHL